MKVIQKVALAVFSVGVLIGLGTHIDGVYHSRSKKAQALDMNIDTSGTARKTVKRTRAKRKKKMEQAQAQAMSMTENGGVSFQMLDKVQGQTYLLFKKIDKHYGFMNEPDMVTVAVSANENPDIKEAKLLGKSGKFKLYAKEVTDWEKPAHDTRDYVWVSEQELKKAISIAQRGNPQGMMKNAKVSIRTKHGQKVELEKHLLAALSNHYGKHEESQDMKAKAPKNQKISQVSEKKKSSSKKAKTKIA